MFVQGKARTFTVIGTAIAGIIRSIAPEAEIGSFRVLGHQLSSRTPIVCEGVRQALDRRYQILNCSVGCPGVSKYLMGFKILVDEAYLMDALSSPRAAMKTLRFESGRAIFLQ
jgi:hypothetical protein